MHELVQPDHRIECLRDRFPENTSDIDWLSTLAKDDEGEWILVSGDLGITRRPEERRVWKEAGITTFFMAKGFTKRRAWEQVRWLIDKWPLIVEQAERVNPGAAFIVPRRGNKLTAV